MHIKEEAELHDSHRDKKKKKKQDPVISMSASTKRSIIITKVQVPVEVEWCVFLLFEMLI